MWSYYGAKTNVVNLYPPPRYAKIIEPFAGSARYSLRYFEKEVMLVDKYEVVIKIWKWLQQCTPADILGLPRMKVGEHIDQYSLCEEARLLLGFLIGFTTVRPRKTVTTRLNHRPNWLNYSLERIAKNLFKIKHWVFQCSSYEQVPNEPATWFIDPPYEIGGELYPASNRKIDYSFLASWSRARQGQVIVCENSNGAWLPFIPVGRQRTQRRHQHEFMWTNTPTSYNVTQPKIFNQK